MDRYKGVAIKTGKDVYGQLIVIDDRYFIVEDVEVPGDWNTVIHEVWEDSLEEIL